MSPRRRHGHTPKGTLARAVLAPLKLKNLAPSWRPNHFAWRRPLVVRARTLGLMLSGAPFAGPDWRPKAPVVFGRRTRARSLSAWGRLEWGQSWLGPEPECESKHLTRACELERSE